MSRYDGRFLQSYASWDEYIDQGRDKHSRPLCNNTVVRRRGENRIAITYHSTDLYTFYSTGDIFLSNGGYETVSTRTRMPHTVFSGHHDGLQRAWYVMRAPAFDDPRPNWAYREIPHPFTVENPGPEPVDDRVGCKAGEVEHELVERWTYVPEADCTPEELAEPDVGYGHPGQRWVSRTVQESTLYTEDHPHYMQAREREVDHDKRCRHCELFDYAKRVWHNTMYGAGWGRQRGKGYAQMLEWLERFNNSRKAWLEAAREDFRRVRRLRAEYRAWLDRNSQCMDDGPVLIDLDGYAMTLTPKERKALVKLRAAEQRERDLIKRIERGELVKVVSERIATRRVKLDSPIAELLIEALARAGFRPFDFLDPDAERATIGPIRDRRRDIIHRSLTQYGRSGSTHLTPYARRILK